MITNKTKIDFLIEQGVEIKFHYKQLKTGYLRLYIDAINDNEYTTASQDQKSAGILLDAFYWTFKIKHGTIDDSDILPYTN